MDVFTRLGEYDHERVVFCHDSATGLRAIIAVHDTTLGPGLGGVRMYPYPTEPDALEDVLRLSRGMTYKAAISGVDLGGAKSVIIGDSRSEKTPELLRAMGRFIDAQAGSYIAGQDIGTNPHDMAEVRAVTRHVSCVHPKAGGAGDASRATAFGVMCGIRAVLQALEDSDDLEGRRIAVQGLGNVGYDVARRCAEGGAAVTVCDVVAAPVERALEELGVAAVPHEEIYDVECDVFSPCSVGAVVNDETIDRFRCHAIAGGANNVLAEPRHGSALTARGITYAPDYLVNSGGLIRCQEEVLGNSTDDARIFRKVEQIYEQTLEVIRVAAERGIDTAVAADLIAEQRIDAARASGKAWNPNRRRDA